MEEHLPNFFIVGAPKAGTTSLYYYLDQHPEIYMSPVKEPNFFSYEEIVKQNLFYEEKGIGNLNDYKKLFSKVKNEKAIGEASVSYLFYPTVPKKIKNIIPDAKIIIILRNPVERAYSHYLMDYRLGYVNIPFEEIVYKKTQHKWSNLYFQQYIELGFYFNQVKRYLDTFGKKQVKVFLNEDLKYNVRQVMFSLYEFLGVTKSFMPNLQEKHNTFEMPKNKIIQKIYSSKVTRDSLKKMVPSIILRLAKKFLFEKGKKPELNTEIREYLKGLYKDDVLQLESLINRDLSSWYK